MEEYLNNSKSELLSQYLDNELDPAKEQELFSMLSEDDALQSEMKEMLAIRETVQQDTEAFTPPQKSTKRIFAALGYTVPAATISGGIVASTGSFLSKVWLPTVSAVVASLVTALLVFNYIDDGSNDTASNTTVNTNTDIPIVSSTEADETFDILNDNRNSQSSMANGGIASSSSSNSESVPNAENSTANSKNRANLFGHEDSEQSINSSSSKRDIANQSEMTDSQNEAVQNTLFGINPAHIAIYSNYNFADLNYGFRSDRYDIDENPMSSRKSDGHMVSIYIDGLQNTNNELYNNKSIGILLRNFGNFRGGFEASIQDMFITSATTDLGSYLISAYLVGRYENPNWDISGIQPFAQFNIGFSNIGPTGHLMIGAEYILANLFGADLGLQASYGNSYFYSLNDKKGFNQDNLNIGLSFYLR